MTLGVQKTPDLMRRQIRNNTNTEQWKVDSQKTKVKGQKLKVDSEKLNVKS